MIQMTLRNGADMIIRTCMGAKPDESMLIVTDTCMDERIGNAFFDAAVDADCEALLLTMKPRTQHGEEPPLVVAEAMRSADVILAPTLRSLTHTKARQDACKMGARAATLPGITMDMMVSGGMGADYGKMAAVANEVLETLDGAQEMRVTTKLGTMWFLMSQDVNGRLTPVIVLLPGQCRTCRQGNFLLRRLMQMAEL